MTTTRSTSWLCLTLTLLLGCSNADPPPAPNPGDPAECEATEDVSLQLLTAPTTATVVKKTPAHPPLQDGQLP
jgi:hypothetical protein